MVALGWNRSLIPTGVDGIYAVFSPFLPFPSLPSGGLIIFHPYSPVLGAFSVAICSVSYRTVQRWSTGSLSSEVEVSRKPTPVSLGIWEAPTFKLRGLLGRAGSDFSTVVHCLWGVCLICKERRVFLLVWRDGRGRSFIVGEWWGKIQIRNLFSFLRERRQVSLVDCGTWLMASHIHSDSVPAASLVGDPHGSFWRTSSSVDLHWDKERQGPWVPGSLIPSRKYVIFQNTSNSSVHWTFV